MNQEPSTKTSRFFDIEPKWLVLLTVGVGTFMSALDGSVVNAILPVIQAYFKTDVATVEWVVTIYLLAVSGLLLTFGRLGDLRGNKTVYMWGFVIFTTGSALAGFSPTPTFLIGSRALQALGAAMLFANSPAILTKAFPGAERGRALGLQGTMTYLGLTTGPFLGGWLANRFGWHAVFFINIPIGLLAIWSIPAPGALTESQTEAFRAALEEYRSTLAFSADMPSGRHNWALFEDALGRPAEAEKQYRKALALDDQFFMSAANLAIVLNRQGRNEEAEALLQQAVRADPRNAASSFNLGLLLAEMGKNEQAETALRAGVRGRSLARSRRVQPGGARRRARPRQAAELCRQGRAAPPRGAEVRFRPWPTTNCSRERKRTPPRRSNRWWRRTRRSATPFSCSATCTADRGRQEKAAALYDRALAAGGLADRDRTEITARRRALPQ